MNLAKSAISFYHLGLTFLVIAICVSAILVIKVSQESRKLFAKYHELQVDEQNYQDELGRLQLQEGYESTIHDLELKAKRKLEMFSPQLTDRWFLK